MRGNKRRITFACPTCGRPAARMTGSTVVVVDGLEFVEQTAATEIVCGCGQRSTVDHFMQSISAI